MMDIWYNLTINPAPGHPADHGDPVQRADLRGRQARGRKIKGDEVSSALDQFVDELSYGHPQKLIISYG
jgi:hypothetical protein